MSSWKARAVVVITAFLLGCVVSYFPIKAYFQAKSATLTPKVDNLYVYPPKSPCKPPFSVTTSDDV